MGMAPFHTAEGGADVPAYASSSENLTTAKNVRSPKTAGRRKLFLCETSAARVASRRRTYNGMDG